MTRSRIQLTGWLALAVLAGAAPQAEPPSTDPAGPVPAALDTAAPGPLLREGSFVLQARGTLHRSEPEGRWIFRLQAADPAALLYEVTLLPCTLLANLEQLIESMPEETVVFDLTGQVFVYRERNYLLPTHAPRLVEHVEPSRPAAAEDGGEPPADDSAEAILRDLERAAGPVPRSPRPERGASERSGASRRLVAPGTVMLWRRGWMVREPSGAWSFVFEADASGLADPPMILLPCLLLEELERHAQRSGPDRALLVSGRVYRYRGRNYLLPTMFQVPRNFSALRP